MEGAYLDRTAYGCFNNNDFLMVEEAGSESESVDEMEEEYAYLNPPANGYPDDGERPPFILIEPYAYYADRDNATTASCKMRNLGSTLKVTFCIAHPPLVSYLCVHFTGFHPTDFAVQPHIVATEASGGLVLLRLVIEDPAVTLVHPKRHFFMYDASVPSLEHLPPPGYRHMFNNHSITIVRNCKKGSTSNDHHHGCSHCDYVLAAQSRGFGHTESSQLILYRSDRKTWSKVPVMALNSSYPSHRTCKTLTIGGDKGTVAWVDLWRNIHFCDVLDKCPMIRTLELPPPIVPTDTVDFGNPRSVRDIAVLGGFIKYVELQYLLVEQGDSYTWKATVWSINTAGISSSEGWHMDYLINSTEIPKSSLPKLRVGEGILQPTLSTLHIGLPNLSLQDDGIVYFLSKIDYRDNTHIAWVLAVDMRNKTVQKVGEFSARRTAGLENGYTASRISEYLKGPSGAKRPGMTYLVSSRKKHHGNSM